ncbi:c-type cytochrome biogenesis protein CcmI [Kaistia defluvii]|uniref:c-type cytochrome biogenesis protein CcmI n=1 Tax=Kaistia defluvii TaxID=410841 RepID=UPI002257785B|nr:c-type cytochrome biogenesis protein CcmI [Kaistia defluvii]MCX5519466.1 c-type cytochrome biogenesis protein CcmI [Kaistia defluvii]
MLLWIVMAVLTAAASLAVLIPLGRQPHAPAHAGAARSIYRDQLDELVRDRERGLIGDAEADAARIEISRRLLNSDSGAAAEAPAPPPAYRIERLVALVLLPLLACGIYLYVGSPQLADRPAVNRAAEPTAQGNVDDLIAKVESHLAANPEDGRGWEVLSPIYMRLGRFDDAVRALGNAKRLLGSTAERESLYGEALTRASGNVVTEEARAAFDRALKFDPDDVRSRFFLAMALGQAGQKDDAIAAWKALIASAPADAPWLAAAQAELAQFQPTSTVTAAAPTAGPVAPGPTASDIAAAAQQSPAERQQMIEGMVSGLAARLDADPKDTTGWERLFRAYMVLGKPDEARAALLRARASLAEKPELLAVVEQAARDIGIGKD